MGAKPPTNYQFAGTACATAASAASISSSSEYPTLQLTSIRLAVYRANGNAPAELSPDAPDSGQSASRVERGAIDANECLGHF
jgi:hypothetical protein